MGKEGSQKSFFIAVVLVLGAIVFAASLHPENTGQIVTKNSFEPITEKTSLNWLLRLFGVEREQASSSALTNPQAIECMSCPLEQKVLFLVGNEEVIWYNGIIYPGYGIKEFTCKRKKDCPSLAKYCSMYFCEYSCTSGDFTTTTYKPVCKMATE